MKLVSVVKILALSADYWDGVEVFINADRIEEFYEAYESDGRKYIRVRMISGREIYVKMDLQDFINAVQR